MYGRILFRLYRPRPDLRPAPSRRLPIGVWTSPCPRPLCRPAPNTFTFLHQTRRIETAWDWNHPEASRLWLYHLHYFDDLLAEDASARREEDKALIERWIRENPPGIGVGWEPYPLSLRIVNWIKWSLAGNPLSKAALDSLATQARYLARRLEWHLLGNHLWRNIKALLFAQAFFADGLLAHPSPEPLTLSGFWTHPAIAEQILTDGGHFERSPMYHALALEDLLDLVNLGQTYGWEEWRVYRGPIQKMFRWLGSMTHPDGEIALLNDAAFGVAPTLSALTSYAKRLGLEGIPSPNPEGVAYLPASGYVRVATGDWVAFLDCALLGPDHLPAHGHADTLTFELSLRGQRMIVDTGTSLYEEGDERLRQRGTRAHNTPVLDDADSSEVWGSFRVGRRARIVALRVEKVPQGIVVSAAHDGYRRLRGGGTIQRTWYLQGRTLRIEDEIAGKGYHTVTIPFHLHPAIQAIPLGPHEVALARGEERWARLELDPKMRLEIRPTTYHPEFGLSLSNREVVGIWEGDLPQRFVTTLHG